MTVPVWSGRKGGIVKAVRSVEGGVAVVELDEPPGAGTLLEMRSTSVCGSDLSYIRFDAARSWATSSPVSARTALRSS